MKKSKLFEKWNVHLDLAVEAHELLRGETNQDVPGVIEKKETFRHASVNTITITDQRGEKLLGRPQGNYVTLEVPEIKENNFEHHKKISEILAQKLSDLIRFHEKASFLIIGLGNRNATPDALGPKVVEKIMVTRHLFHYAPEEIKGNLRNVAAISPGVLGITGIETAEVIRGLVEHVKPDYVIAIDALAAGALDRIGSSIQLADTGINPGSGIGNFRKGLNEETLGCKVIGIGVPTVVNAAVIAHKTIEELFAEMETHPSLAQIYDEENEESIVSVMEKALSPFKDSLMVTPKEIDELIETTSRIIANALNMSIHPGIDPGNDETYLM
ncbi:spore protease [Syntrophobotulus glycolicus DSM 8271]|uniref:Germination protease n=1 Tax=Syntrophobotulus glycolicus (strain DSM 8271 / FlGlyR) TaxID=645991 RepID=F0SUF9_SYNGF|nr:GPR endopeptidase [Syntrophobotulus glycolicus]ADY56609.1 spore protease [Syntrophobotulus glycolicus DSM 8271]